jgi:hypothetical protein
VSEPLPGILGQVEALTAQWADAMARLRFGTEDRPLEVPGADAEGHDVHEALLAVRDRLDMAELLLKGARIERRRIRARARIRQQERDDEYDRRLAKLAEGAVRREFEGAQERMAKARLDVVELTRAQRKAEAVRDLVDDAYEGLRDQFFGLLNIRQELLDRLRELQWESSMERG